MPLVPGLRTPYARVGRLVYFGRMLDKIRLFDAGQLPPDYHSNLGEGQAFFFDARCCRFLGVPYEELRARVRAGGTDEEILQWAEARGIPRSDEDCVVWNRFMMKIGWRDERTAALQQRVVNFGLVGKGIETGFDFLEVDEGRDPLRRRSWDLKPATVILVMGVAGSGKTTVGHALAQDLGWSFHDADDFHPPANVAKMSAGTPLTDEDRAPWLDAIRSAMDEMLRRDESGVFTCSALKRPYRERLFAGGPPGKRLVYLRGSRELLWKRISSRQNHFMKPELLDSQLAALEEPSEALTFDIAPPPEQLVAQIRRGLEL